MMQDSVLVRHKDLKDGKITERRFDGVHCVMSKGIVTDPVGWKSNGMITVRIPGAVSPEIRCGDQIAKAGDGTWFTVTEVRENQQNGSRLSHYKILGRR